MVVITGTLTNCCCESTAREANTAGYKVILVCDAAAATTDAEHNAALLNLRISFADIKTVAQVLDLLNLDKFSHINAEHHIKVSRTSMQSIM